VSLKFAGHGSAPELGREKSSRMALGDMPNRQRYVYGRAAGLRGGHLCGDQYRLV